MGRRDGIHYGTTEFYYAGSGTLTDAEQQTIPCDFEAFQFTSGRVLLLVRSDAPTLFLNPWIVSFTGTDQAGRKLWSEGKLTEEAYLPRPGEALCHIAFKLTKLVVQHSEEEELPTRLVYGITNLRFLGEPRRAGRGFHSNEVRIETGADAAPVALIRRRRGYRSIVEKMETSRKAAVTAELVFLQFQASESHAVDAIAEAICYVLSVASGTKVQWVYRIERSRKRRTLSSLHTARVTKRFTPLAPIDLNSSGVVRSYVENCLPTYLERRDRFGLNRRLIDWYLDAKTESDYLESRAAKAAVAMEALKDAYLAAECAPDDASILPADQFAAILPELQEAMLTLLKRHRVGKEEVETLTDLRRLQGLNRRSFRHILLRFARFLGLNIRRDVDRFVLLRNRFIHTGSFLRENGENPAQQYLFVVDVLDRFLLRLIGYSGAFQSWRSGSRTASNV